MSKILKKAASLVFADESVKPLMRVRRKDRPAKLLTERQLTTKYENQEKGVLKVQPNYQYSYLEGEELHNFVLAVKEYYERVSRKLYKQDPDTGKPLQVV